MIRPQPASGIDHWACISLKHVIHTSVRGVGPLGGEDEGNEMMKLLTCETEPELRQTTSDKKPFH